MTLLTPRLADLRDVFVARGAEQAGLPTPDLAHFLHYAGRCALLH